MARIQSLYLRLSNFLSILAVATGYFVLARLSLEFSFQNSNATPLWPPSGFAFAIILLFGYRIAPGITIGAFVVNVAVFLSSKTTNLPTALWVSAFISIGNTAEALAGYYLLKRMVPEVKDNNYFRKVNYIFIFLLVTIIMCLASSFVGTTAVLLGKIILIEDYSIAWLTWWLGDVSGILLFTPFILIWVNFFIYRTNSANIYWKRRKIIEAAALFFLVILTSEVVFNNWIFTFYIFRWAFWIIPVVVWASIHFKQHETITAILLCSVIAVAGTINGNGPFSNLSSKSITALSSNESLLILQAFISIVAITALALNASVNEQKQTEAALRAMTDHLEMRVRERTAELERAHEQLIEAEKSAAKHAMSNTIAHEIRNPLTSIRLSLNLLKEKLASMKDIPDIECSLDIISRNHGRIDQLVKDLLYSHKPEQTNFRKINLAETMEEVLQAASDRISLNEIFLEKDLEKDCIISADDESLKIALLNIIVNAIEAMVKNKGRLHVCVTRQDKTIVLAVRDNGCGMTQEETARMFEPYYSKKPSGLGVGLTNVQTILKNHNARTEVKSEPRKGTLFMISFDGA